MRLIGLGTLLALVVVGCGEPLEPSDFAGTYALRAVGGSPLPVTVPVLSNGGTISSAVAASSSRPAISPSSWPLVSPTPEWPTAARSAFSSTGLSRGEPIP